MAQAIVVGGGLAGLSAAHTLLERGANVLLLDKQPYVYLRRRILWMFIAFLFHEGLWVAIPQRPLQVLTALVRIPKRTWVFPTLQRFSLMIPRNP